MPLRLTALAAALMLAGSVHAADRIKVGFVIISQQYTQWFFFHFQFNLTEYKCQMLCLCLIDLWH